jgi:hypothetical protein
VADETIFRGGSSAESDVIDEVWKEIGGELVQEFVVPTIPGQRSRVRRLDGVFAVDGPRRRLPVGTPLSLRDRDVVICQAKAGQLDLGVLGQTLFSAELLEREHSPRSLRLIAAAVRPDPLIERLLESSRPLGWHIEYRTYPGLRLGKSSSARASSAMRQEMVAAIHGEAGGLLISVGGRRGSADFANVRVSATGESLRSADPDAIILPARLYGQATATTAAEVAASEPVTLVYTSKDLYMTPMGRAVFGGEIARSLLGLTEVTSVLRYRKDNPVLRKLIERLPNVVLPR